MARKTPSLPPLWLKTFLFLSSIRFTVILLALTVFSVAVATFIESSQNSHEAAASWVYSHPLFTLMLAGYFVNILFSALSRAPYRSSHLPFLITHLGLLLILTGQFLKIHYGDQLQVFLPLSQKVDFGSAKKGYSLLIKERDQKEPHGGTHLTQIDFDENYFQEKATLPIKTPLSEIDISSPKKISIRRTLAAEKAYLRNSPFSQWLLTQYPYNAQINQIAPISFTSLKVSDALGKAADENPLLWSSLQEKSETLATAAILQKFEEQFTTSFKEWINSELKLIDPVEQKETPFDLKIELKKQALWRLFLSEKTEDTYFHRQALHDLFQVLRIHAPLHSSQKVVCYDLLTGDAYFHQSFALMEHDSLHQMSLRSSHSTILLDESQESAVFFLLQPSSADSSKKHFSFDQLSLTAGTVYINEVPWVLSLDQGYSGTAIQIDSEFATEHPFPLKKQLALTKQWEKSIAKGLDTELFPSLPVEKAQALWNRVLAIWPSSTTLWPDKKTFSPEELASFNELIEAFDIEHPQIKTLLPIVNIAHTLLKDAHLMDQLSWIDHLKAHKWPLMSSHKNLDQHWSRVQLLLGQIQLAKALAGPSEPTPFSSPTVEEKEKAFWALMLLSNMHPQTFMKRELEQIPPLSPEAGLPIFLPLTTVETNTLNEDLLYSISLEVKEPLPSQGIRIALDRSPSPLMHPIEQDTSLQRTATLVPARRALGHQLMLLEAKQTFYPNSLLPMSYDAAVLIDGEKVSLSMNRVHETKRHWRFYLSSMQPRTAKNKTPTWVALTASRDPFKYFTTYPGCLLVALGAALLFWPKKPALRKPIIKKTGIRKTGIRSSE